MIVDCIYTILFLCYLQLDIALILWLCSCLVTAYMLSSDMKRNLVIDTCILVTALLSENGASREILRRCLKGEYIVNMGAALYLEYESLLSRDKVFDKCVLSQYEREELLNAFFSVCKWVNVYYLLRPNLKDEADNHLIELAVAGGCDAIVTNNVKNFKQSQLLFPEIKIIQPSQLIKGEL